MAENQRVTLTIDRSQITGKAAGQFAVVNEHIQEGTGAANIIVEVDNTPVSYPKGTFVEANGCIAMEAQHYTAKRDVPGGGFALLKPETIMYSSICPPPHRSPLSQSSISAIRSMAERCRL